MIFKLDDKAVAEGTILVLGIRYPGSNSARTYTYGAMKAGGRWYLTGTGRTPQDAGWGAVQRWLESDGRHVVWVKVATNLESLWEEPLDGEVVQRALPAAQAKANHPSRTGSPAASQQGLARFRGDRRTDTWSPAASEQGLDISDRWYPR